MGKRNNLAQPQTQWRLMWRQFTRHKVARFSLYVLIVFYVIGVVLPGFVAPYSPHDRGSDTYLPPQKIRFVDEDGNFSWRPFVYPWKKELDQQTWEITYTPDTSNKQYLTFFVRGVEYKILGLIPSQIHLFGVEDGARIHLLGTDSLGRDFFSRIIYGCQVSLTIGFVGVFISLVLGLIIGGISGLVGGRVDDAIQRIIETIMSIPTIPLWMALAAAVPRTWSALQVYFAITVILSVFGWTGIARVVRSKFMALREEDFVTAAIGYNASRRTIILKHLIPNFLSYIIVNITLSIPGMIIGETSLSFLGIGLRPPVVSLGVLLEQAQSFQTVVMFPWLLIPGLFITVIVLAYNFVGDGLRDAADPYKFIS
jgi:peptide/nickel transport system permease protein